MKCLNNKKYNIGFLWINNLQNKTLKICFKHKIISLKQIIKINDIQTLHYYNMQF